MDRGNMDKQNFRRPFYKTLNTTLGEIGVFYCTAGDNERFLYSVGNKLDSLTDEDFACTLFPLICRPLSKFVDGKYKSPDPVFTSDEIKSLSQKEMDDIADVFLTKNKYLYFKSDNITEKDPGGGTRVRVEYNQIEHPIRENESKLAYLRRVFILYNKKAKEDIKKTFESTLRFSEKTNASIISRCRETKST
jgi:hypothetical protein